MKDSTGTYVQKGPKITSVFDAFDLLKTSKHDDKVTGAIKIISQLQGGEEKNFQYVLKRLIRSLGANVAETRTGYFATLVALLVKYDQITVSQLTDLMKKELHAHGSSKSEVGDVALGHILLCGAVFRSKLILRCSKEEQNEVLQILTTASNKKSYLGTAAHLILLDFVNKLDEEQFSTIVWSNIKQDFKKEIKDHNLDSLHFLLVVSTKFPNKVNLRKLIGVPEILCEDNILPICEKLMAGIDFNLISHPIYKEIGIQIANSPHLLTFWTAGVDSKLIKHNRNRELVSLNILTIILNNMKENFEVVPELLSKNFFKLFMDWFRGLQTASKIRNKRDNEDDHKLVVRRQKELLNALAKVLKQDSVESKTKVETLKKLLFYPGEMNFTAVSGTTVVKSIIADLNEDGVKKMAKLLKRVLLNTSKKTISEGVERSWYNNERVKAAEIISYLVSHEAVKDNTEFKLTYMKKLMCFGFFKLSDDNDVTISSELSGAIKSCFYRCFASRLSNVDSLVTILSSLCKFMCSILEKEQIRTKIEKQFPEENMECWELLTGICQNIEKNETKSKVDNVFLVLLYQLGLFLFSEPTHVKVARSSIKELKSCYEHYKTNKKQKGKKIKESSSADEPEWIEVLVEVLLSILSVESSVLRSVVQCVFTLLCEYITPTCIGQIVSVLDPDSESNPLSHESETEGEDSEDENRNSDDNEENGDDKEESDSNIEDDDDEDVKIPDQLRMAVQKALGAAAPDTDTESIDADMIDEEEGKKLDEALADAFKQFNQGKGKKSKKDRKDKKALSDFRIRVLDLIDIYLEKDPSMDVCLGMMGPLTSCLEFCITDVQFRELEHRIRKTIKNLSKIRKFATTDDVTIGILCDYLKSIIDKGSRSHFVFQALGDVITCFATFIIHCSQKINTQTQISKHGKEETALIEIFKEALQSFFQNRNCLLPIIFFHNVLQADWEGSFELVPIIATNIFNTDIRQFRRSEGLELMSSFFRSLNRTKSVSDQQIKKLLNLEETFVYSLRQALKRDSGFQAKNNFFVGLNKLINFMKKFHDSCKIESTIDFRDIIETVQTSKSFIKIKNNQKNQGSAVQNKQNKKSKKNKQSKRKLEQTNGHEPLQKKIRKNSSRSDSSTSE